MQLAGAARADYVSDRSAGLELGDIVVGRGAGSWISRLITALDGYWSHASIHVGDGLVAEANSHGICTTSIDRFIARYPEGVARARTRFPTTVRSAAAGWARDLAGGRGGQSAGKYSGRDLGMAFALLLRARARGGLEQLPVLTAESDLEGIFSSDGFKSTCSGLVYRAYRDGGGVELNIVPAPGILVHDDGRLSFPDEDDLFERLTAEDQGLQTLESLLPGRSDMEAWRDKARLLAGAAAGWVSLVPKDRTVAVESGVTPGDLWCSPDVTQRRFFSADHAATALSAIAHCNDQATGDNCES